MKAVIEMYVTMMPVIFGGIFNMVFVKMPVFNFIKTPLDNGLLLKDGRPLFGKNKTYKGFIGMVVLTMLCNMLWGSLCASFSFLEGYNLLYVFHNNTLWYNILLGALLGLVYVLSELPNSFLKRRLQIAPGQSKKGGLGFLLLCLDQVDSLLGCVLVIAFFYPMDIWYYLFFVILGGLTHFLINVSLYLTKLKNNV